MKLITSVKAIPLLAVALLAPLVILAQTPPVLIGW